MCLGEEERSFLKDYVLMEEDLIFFFFFKQLHGMSLHW